MKHLFFILLCFSVLTGCNNEENSLPKESTTETPINISLSENSKGVTYKFQKNSLPSKCISDNEIICEIEKNVKCALSPTQKYCDKQSMPEFLFYDDTMFSEDGVTGRPSEQSFKIIKIKPIDNNTIEVITEGTCDQNWFGACNGNIIYVLSNKTNNWKVKEIYAMEIIK